MGDVINWFEEMDDEFLILLATHQPSSLQKLCLMVSLDIQLQKEGKEIPNHSESLC